MTYFYFTILFATLIAVVWLVGHYLKQTLASRWRLQRWKNSPRIKPCLPILDTLYQGCSGHELARTVRQELEHDDMAYTYGEVVFYSFASVLEFVKPKPGSVFYDLGSGIGKAVFTAALLYDFSKLHGVERLDALHAVSEQKLAEFKKLPMVRRYFSDRASAISFQCGDLLTCDISDASIVYVNATCFIGDFWQAVATKLLTIPSGAIVILNSRELDPEQFVLIDARQHLMSWGYNRISIYRRRFYPGTPGE